MLVNMIKFRACKVNRMTPADLKNVPQRAARASGQEVFPEVAGKSRELFLPSELR